MERKTIFQLAIENYDVQHEIRKIDDLFTNHDYFSADMVDLTFKELIDTYLFQTWKYKGTCVDVDEFFSLIEATVPEHEDVSENCIINYLEAIENFFLLYKIKAKMLNENYSVKYYGDLYSVLYDIVKMAERHLGVSKKEYKDKIVLYPKNAPLDNVIETIEDEDVQWELIRYSREDLSLYEKQKSLAILATNLYIEEDNKEKEPCLNSMIRKATNILNNLHIRHNNKTGKYMSEALSDIDEDEAKTLCDYVFNLMLIIVLLRKQPDFEKVYQDFNKKQKAAKNKNAGDKKDD